MSGLCGAMACLNSSKTLVNDCGLVKNSEGGGIRRLAALLSSWTLVSVRCVMGGRDWWLGNRGVIMVGIWRISALFVTQVLVFSGKLLLFPSLPGARSIFTVISPDVMMPQRSADSVTGGYGMLQKASSTSIKVRTFRFPPLDLGLSISRFRSLVFSVSSINLYLYWLVKRKYREY